MNSFRRYWMLSIFACFLNTTTNCQPAKNGPAPRIKTYTGLAAQRAKDRGWTIYQGDIIQDKLAPVALDGRPRPEMLTVASQSSLWPPPQGGGVPTVYYVNANAGATDPVDEAANANIQTAITTFNTDFAGVIQWVAWQSSDGPNYVEIDLNADDFSGECEAAEGYEAEPMQPMTGSAACAVGTILHEMGHIIGLWHEFERPDADNYVTVNYGNVIKGSWGNFETLTQNAQILGLYDFASVMQYLPYSFSRNGGPVIETIPAGMPLGNAEGVPAPGVDGAPATDYSAGDKEAIMRLYGAPPTKVTVTSNPIGLQLEVDGSTVTTPQTYTWALNSTHTLTVVSGVQTLSGDIDGSTTAATFYYTFGRWNDNGSQSHTIKVLPGDGGTGFPATSPQVATYSANFIQLVPYTTTIYPASAGTVAASPLPQTYSGTTGEFFVARQQATLTATPASGQNFYQFNNGPFWLEGGLGANPKTFNVPDTGDPVNTTVYFSSDPVYTVDITPETYSSNLAVYVDGQFTYTPANFTLQYIPPGQTTSTWTTGSSHTLSIDTPQKPYSINSRYAFSQWTAGGMPVTPANPAYTISSLPSTKTSYVATVIPQFAPATNFSYPPCGGTGTLTPASPTGDGFYPTGTPLTFTASPASEWTFGGWTFDLTGTTTPAMLSPTDESLVFANFNIVAAPLTMTSVSPASAIAGGAAFTLTLYGTGFSPDSVVGVVVGTTTTYPTVTYVSQGELTVQIPPADIASPGTFQIYVENFPPVPDTCAVFGYQTFLVHASALATSTVVTSSINPSAVGISVTFTATVTSAESNATGTVTFKDGSTVLGTGTPTGSGIATYSTSSLALGTHSITAVYGGDSNNLSSTSGVLTQTVTNPATMSTPAPGGVLGTSNVQFTWTMGTNVTQYQLWLGLTGPGSSGLYTSGWLTTQSTTVTSLPAKGATVYARLYSTIAGKNQYFDYTYTEAPPPNAPATMSTPTQGSTLGASNVQFTWTAGIGVTQYNLWLGLSGPGSSGLYTSGWLAYPTTTTTVTSLPANGATVYARLYSMIGGKNQYNDYTYTESVAGLPATMTTPAESGSVLGTSEVPFAWTKGTNVTQYQLWLGTTGAGSSGLYTSGWLTTQSTTVPSLPAKGATVYARLYSTIGGKNQYVDYTYTEQ